MIDDLLPTWWERHPPQPHFDPRTAIDHITARDGGIPITAPVFRRIPDDAAYIPYYLWLTTTWPGATRFYRANPLLHRRTIFTALKDFQRSRDAAPLRTHLTPLIERNPIIALQETLVFLRNQNTIVLSDAQFDTVLDIFLDIPFVLMDPTVHQSVTEWIQRILLPWCPTDESTELYDQKIQLFQFRWSRVETRWNTRTAEFWTNVHRRWATFQEELFAVTWSPERDWIPWVCSVDERKGLTDRWRV